MLEEFPTDRQLYALSLADGQTLYVIHRSLDAAIEFASLANRIKSDTEVVFAADCTGSFLMGRMGENLGKMLQEPRVGLVRQTIQNPIEGYIFKWGLCKHDGLGDDFETPVDLGIRTKPKPVSTEVSLKELEAI